MQTVQSLCSIYLVGKIRYIRSRTGTHTQAYNSRCYYKWAGTARMRLSSRAMNGESMIGDHLPLAARG
eukprot:6184659-Pleurochrysis_carterae.AAC.1